MARTATKRKPKDVAIDPCEAFVKLCSGKIAPPFDRKLVAGAVGDRTVATLAEVGRAFGVAAQTPRKEWRSAGMPGDAKAWNLVDITIWRLERDWKEVERQREIAGPKSNRAQEIELRLLELRLADRERENLEASGRMADIFLMRAELGSMLSVARKQFMEVPRLVTPILCKRCNEPVIAELNKDLNRALQHMAEMSHHMLAKDVAARYAEILQHFNEAEQNDANRNDASGSGTPTT